MSMTSSILETPRFSLRLFRDDDVDFLAAMYADPEVMRFYPSLRTREYAAEQIAKYADTFAVKGYTLWAVEEEATGELVGRVGLWPLDETDEVELGYMIARQHWGRGVATEASSVCIDYGFHQLKLGFIAAICVAGNTASRRVMEKLGFRYVRDDRYYDTDVRYHRLEKTGFKNLP